MKNLILSICASSNLEILRSALNKKFSLSGTKIFPQLFDNTIEIKNNGIMKEIIISIYPDCNGQMLVEACNKNTSIKFVTKKKNIIWLLAVTRLKVLVKEVKRKLIFS